MAPATFSLGAPVLRPHVTASISTTTTKVKVNVKAKPKKGKDRPRSTGFGWVLQWDREFLSRKLEPAVGRLSVLKSRVSKVVGDAFWLRFLEATAPWAAAEEDGLPAWPSPSYPGLSGMDLLMADLEALKLYSSYFQQILKIWSMPLPEKYDSEKVAVYFNCRPHIVAVRILEVFSSFTLAAIKLQASKRLEFTRVGEDGESENSEYYFGKVLKEAMLRLGPTFIKVGQSLSTRPDLIGAEIAKALSELQENITPFPRSEAMKIIEEELRCPVEDAFSYVSEETIAAASFGQVYRGCTPNGCPVAIKVQRPNLLHSVVRDIYILRLGLGLVRKLAKRRSDIRLYADELGRGFVGELDYTLEAANATEFLEAHSQYSFIAIPKVFKHLTKKRVLTMQWLPGANPTVLFSLLSSSSHDGDLCSTKQQIDARKDLLDLVNKGVKASLIQLLDTGLLHADPHPGNLRYTPEGQIGFFDFGLLCRMEKKHQLAMLASITHIACGDWGALAQDLTEMDVIPPRTNIRRVTWDLEETLGEAVFVDGIPDIKFSKVLGKIWSVALKYHFRMPPYYTLVLRCLASLEGLAVAADPNFKTFQAACPYVIQKLIYENSYATRRILYSVVFNKGREFRWHRLQLFIKVGLTRKSTWSDTTQSIDLKESRNGVVEVANVICRLLASNDGIVVRRLVMDADPVSLVQAATSKEAVVLRQHLSKALAVIIYKWMSKHVGATNHGTGVGSQDRVASAHPPSSSATLLLAVARDRRVKVIFYKVMNAVRSNPILLLRFCWSCLMIWMSAGGMALHRLTVSLSEKYLSPSLAHEQRKMAVVA